MKQMMDNEKQTHIQEKAKKLLQNVSPEMKDALYRSVWHEHVQDDVRGHMEGTGYDLSDYDLSEDEITLIADRYVYEGEYDCNCSYWDNLEALMDDVVKKQIVYSIPFTYQRIGRIEIHASSKEKALEKAANILNGMNVTTMEQQSVYLENSETIDRDGIIVDIDGTILNLS